ncbi:DUF1559 domain-containing protein [Anatilimnocola sp. NA78]|uniref:DUF1559 family PulG-like putative transporter n=1 Tax=Anatilimnocola sp. NA78 TaxID=3415683 RepID=UPI003CE507EE
MSETSPRAFTLKTLMIVVTILCVLMGLLFPAINTARMRAQRMDCANNLKVLSLGLQNYHDTFLYLPYGARNRTTGAPGDIPNWGSSWLLATTPFCEQRPTFDQVVAQESQSSRNDYLSAAVQNEVANARFKYMLCPFSPLPPLQNIGGLQLTVPSYAGIMGANELTGQTPATINVIDAEQRLVVGPYQGIAAANGMLPVNECLSLAACTDGTANTLIVGEVSHWYSDGRKQRNPALSVADAGDSASNAAGWIAGTDLPDLIESGGPAVGPDRVLNLITIEHAIGTNGKSSDPKWGTQGIGRCGLNNPLLSSHPGGAWVAFTDAHVQLLTIHTDLYVLKRLAIRDDGGVLPDY